MTHRTSNILYYVGLILLAIGAFGLTFAAFFAIIGLPIFVLGILLVSVSREMTLRQRLIPITLFILGVICFWPVWKTVNTVGPEIFVIQENYRGRVNIIFKKGCGKQLKKDDEGIVYEIPVDGVLIVDGEQEYGFINHTYYLVNKNGTRTELPKMDVRDFNEEWTLGDNPNEPSRDKLGVFHWGRTGSVGEALDGDEAVSNENGFYTFKEFYVSTYNDLRKWFDFKYEIKFDSIIDSKIKLR